MLLLLVEELLKEKFAKYINSPETEFYKKGRHIFNLDKARSNIQKNEEVLLLKDIWML